MTKTHNSASLAVMHNVQSSAPVDDKPRRKFAAPAKPKGIPLTKQQRIQRKQKDSRARGALELREKFSKLSISPALSETETQEPAALLASSFAFTSAFFSAPVSVSVPFTINEDREMLTETASGMAESKSMGNKIESENGTETVCRSRLNFPTHLFSCLSTQTQTGTGSRADNRAHNDLIQRTTFISGSLALDIGR
ncbi:hypothetical protein Pelo_18715 [Pelomyxa schiedti]|nr:hypothetical protein Pelo_18715 [Pelomyxa schiedti]